MDDKLKIGGIIVILALVFFYFSNDERKCEQEGGIWVDVSQIEGYYINLGIKTTIECLGYGGRCGEPRIVSSTTVGECDNGVSCWMPDFYEDICLLPL